MTRAIETAEALGNVLPETPIVVYSSMNDPETVRRCMVFGARDYVLKPVQSVRLTQAVNTALAQMERSQMRRAGQLASLRGRGTVITIAGAKGGIGKSVIAVNLALALTRETQRSVVIVDLDSDFGDVATMLDVAPDTTLRDAIPHIGELDRNTVRQYVASHPSGLDVLGAPPDGLEWTDEELAGIAQIIDLLAQTYDFVVADTGPFGDLTRLAVQASTLTLVVTSGEVSGVRDTAAAMRRLTSWGVEDERVKLLLNRGVRVNGYHLDDLTTAIGRDVFWETPPDEKVPLSVQLGEPVVLGDKSAAARSITDLARRIVGSRKPMNVPAEHGSGWRSLLRIGGGQA
jgi:pilus assembly protein CpaE